MEGRHERMGVPGGRRDMCTAFPVNCSDILIKRKKANFYNNKVVGVKLLLSLIFKKFCETMKYVMQCCQEHTGRCIACFSC